MSINGITALGFVFATAAVVLVFLAYPRAAPLLGAAGQDVQYAFFPFLLGLLAGVVVASKVAEANERERRRALHPRPLKALPGRRSTDRALPTARVIDVVPLETSTTEEPRTYTEIELPSLDVVPFPVQKPKPKPPPPPPRRVLFIFTAAPPSVPAPDPTAELRDRAAQLRVFTEHLRNWAEPEFRRQYAEAVPQHLLHARDDIELERRRFFMKADSDPDSPELDFGFFAFVRLHHQDVYERCNGKSEAVLLAEKVQLEKLRKTLHKKPRQPRLAPAPPAPTREELRGMRRKEAEDRRKDMEAALEILSADQAALAAGAVRGRKTLTDALAAEGMTEDDVSELFGSEQAAVHNVLSRFVNTAKEEKEEEKDEPRGDSW